MERWKSWWELPARLDLGNETREVAQPGEIDLGPNQGSRQNSKRGGEGRRGDQQGG